MIGKNTIKLIKSLDLKKNRIKEQLFLAEGDKIVSELPGSGYTIEKLYATPEYLAVNRKLFENVNYIHETSREDIKKASLLKNPQNCIALCRLPAIDTFPEKFESGLLIFLDDIQDPGNLGTIIRICDWFGIGQLFCSPKTADVFNPKVIQASMGSFCRVKVYYTYFGNLLKMLSDLDITVYGAFLDGENVYKQKFPEKMLLVMGNEGNGISQNIETGIEKRIKIPAFGEKSKTADSLNVSVATAIICSEFYRQQFFVGYSK